MKLNDLLSRDGEAAAFFAGLPAEVQTGLWKCGQEVDSLAALRDYARDVSIDRLRIDGSPLDAELRAEWTRSHQV